MADILSKGSLFPEELIPGFIQKTTGASALAKLCGATPIAFNGQKEFTFTLDKEVDIVAENGAKGKGGMTVEPITIVPIKIEYGARVSDEFLYASEDAQMDVLSAFADGFAKRPRVWTSWPSTASTPAPALRPASSAPTTLTARSPRP